MMDEDPEKSALSPSQPPKPSGEELRALIDPAPFAMAVLDSSGRIVHVNSAFSRLIGHTPAELHGTAFADLCADCRPETLAGHIASLVGPGRPFVDFSATLLARSGHKIWAEPVRLTPVRSASTSDSPRPGEPAALASVVDISDRVRLEQRLVHVERTAALGQLAGGIAHDFNNLLTIMQSYCQLAMLELSDDDPGQHSLQKIMNAAERGSQLTRELSHLSTRRAGTYVERDVNQLLTEIHRLGRRLLAPELEFELESEATTQDLSVSVDQASLTRLLINLLLLAKGSMPEGGTLRLGAMAYTPQAGIVQPKTLEAGWRYVVVGIEARGQAFDERALQRLLDPLQVPAGPAGRTPLETLSPKGRSVLEIGRPAEGLTAYRLFLPLDELPVA